MIRSLRARLLLLAAATILVALAAAWLAIARVVEGAVARGFEARLAANLDILAATLEREEETGALRLSALPPDPRFEQPLSGWSWEVREADGRALFASASLWNTTIAEQAAAGGVVLRERRALVPGGGEPVALILAAPEAELAGEIAAVRRPVLRVVGLLGLALIAAAAVQLAIGLRPLAALGRDVAAIRAGRAERLPLPRFAEVAALTEDVNALLAQNAAMVERARRLAGDLAHGLKTPLAAIRNIAAEPGRDPEGEIASAVARMEALLRRHLQRARVAGAAGLPGLRCAVAPVLEDLLFLMRRAHAARALALQVETQGAPDFAGRREDLEEMVGNLLDNACKWAAARVVVTARGEAGRLLLRIADDGPGMKEADRAAALRHGVRLDETKPGQGFGLAIVAETAAICGGSLSLADGGPGLVAELDLPAAGRGAQPPGAHD
jgi:signal transduction histidine kinase